MLKVFGRSKQSNNRVTVKQADETSPNKRSPREVIVERGNALREEVGFGPTDNAADLGSMFLTKTSMDVLQSEGVIVHPDSMDLKEAGLGFAFTCFMAVPVLSALGDKEIDSDPNRFLVSVTNSIFQFFDEDSRVAIFQLGVKIFQEATKSGASSNAFKEFTDQIDTLVMGYALADNPEIVGALENRYQAFRKLYDN